MLPYCGRTLLEGLIRDLQVCNHGTNYNIELVKLVKVPFWKYPVWIWPPFVIRLENSCTSSCMADNVLLLLQSWQAQPRRTMSVSHLFVWNLNGLEEVNRASNFLNRFSGEKTDRHWYHWCSLIDVIFFPHQKFLQNEEFLYFVWFLFLQPLVPAVSGENGQWLVTKQLEPVCKPGGHGVIWKLAHDKGVFEWFFRHGRKGATVRQVRFTSYLCLNGYYLFVSLRYCYNWRFGAALFMLRVFFQ